MPSCCFSTKCIACALCKSLTTPISSATLFRTVVLSFDLHNSPFLSLFCVYNFSLPKNRLYGDSLEPCVEFELLVLHYLITSGIASMTSIAVRDSLSFAPATSPAFPLMYAPAAAATIGETPRESRAPMMPDSVSPSPPPDM